MIRVLVIVALWNGAKTDSASPCNNFYNYACDGWLSQAKKPPYEPTWDPWIATNHEIHHRLSLILSNHNPTLSKPQTFYRSCLNLINYETKYKRELTQLVDNLGGWPLVSKTNKYDWFELLSKVTTLWIHPILKIHADYDYLNPKQVLIYVEPGDLIFPQHILANPGHLTELEAYEKWIFEILKHLYPQNDFNTNEIKEVVKFEIYLAKILDLKSQTKRISVKNLTKKFSVDWFKALRNIFIDFLEISSDTMIAVKNYEFLKNVFLLVDHMDAKTVINYIIWSLVKDLSRDTTLHMKELSFLIDQAILGVNEDLSPNYECLDKVINYFSPLLITSYVKSYIQPKIFVKVSSMFDEIKAEFIKILEESWMSSEAKLQTTEKVKNIKLHLGFDRLNGSTPQQIYRNVQINRNHFLNVLKLKRFKIQYHFFQLSEQKTIWPSSTFSVNAYYSVLQNAVFVPLGLLSSPFFDLNRDNARNYGALGFLLGHEISHSLDPSGIAANPKGQIMKWLPNRDLLQYKQKIICFGDGNDVGEAIADDYGLIISLRAMEEQQTDGKKNFFLAFAQMWCEQAVETDIFTNEEHGPNQIRVKNLLKNKVFTETFSCELTPSCDLW